MNWSKFKTKKVYVGVGILIVLLVLILPIALYVYNPSASLTRSIFKTVPYPVAIIDGKTFITTKTLLADTDAVRNFYENQDFSSSGMRVDFSTKEGQMRLKIKEKEVLDKLIEDTIVKKVSQERGIDVSKEEADKKIVNLIYKEGSLETFEGNLKKFYGWDLDYFRDKVIISQLYLEKLVAYYTEKEEVNTESWQKIQKAKTELENGMDFCEAVSSYSDGDDSNNCGEVGWFEKGYLEPEIASFVSNMKEGGVSDIIKSSLGYHIIFLDEKRKTEKDGAEIEEFKLKQIFVENGGFVEWLREEKKKHNIWILMKDYKWNQEDASVDFRDNKLEREEDRLRIKSEGDPMFY